MGVVFREKIFFRFDFDFALGNFDTKSILDFGTMKSILNFDIINFKITDKFIQVFPSPISLSKAAQDIKSLYLKHMLYPYHLWEK